MRGSIKRVVTDKGFGFIRTDDGTEYFFHRSAVEGHAFESFQEGEVVDFDESPSRDKGPRAERVTKA